MATLQGLMGSLRQLDDGRRIDRGNFKYETSSLLACIFCATIAGCSGARAIADFIEDNFLAIQSVFNLPSPPSHDTINRILISVESTRLDEALGEWSGSTSRDPEHLQVDGKTIRASRCGEDKPLHIVTLYAADYAASLLQEGVYEKQNEITAFERMLITGRMDLAGKTVTGDAMFCQRSFCQKIVDLGGDWIFVLKRNQPTMYQSVEEYFAAAGNTETKVINVSGHGRKGTKTIQFTTDVDWLRRDYDFCGLNCIAKITTTVTEKNVPKTSTLYLIGSVDTLEKLFIARSKHWGIESMHWILDMAFDEDRCTCRTGNAPLNLNIFRKVAIYFFNIAKKTKEYAGHSTRRLMGRCRSKFYHIVSILALA